MRFGNQNYFCCNCGKPIYDARLSMTSLNICKDSTCYSEFELKYTRMILGKDAEKPEAL